jgi:hypothetical protein
MEQGDWMEASDLFEELFFEAVRDEVPLVRFFLQLSTGLHHFSRGQRGAGVERLREGLRVLPVITDAKGADLARWATVARQAIAEKPRTG